MTRHWSNQHEPADHNIPAVYERQQQHTTPRRPIVCVCVILCSKETTHKHSRGCRAQWRRHPTKLCTCAGSRAWSALCTCFCDKIASSFYQGFRLFRYLRLFMLVGKNTCYRPFTLRFWATWLTSPCRSLHGCIHPSDKIDKCVGGHRHATLGKSEQENHIEHAKVFNMSISDPLPHLPARFLPPGPLRPANSPRRFVSFSWRNTPGPWKLQLWPSFKSGCQAARFWGVCRKKKRRHTKVFRTGSLAFQIIDQVSRTPEFPMAMDQIVFHL